MTSDPSPNPRNTTKPGFADWDLGDSDDDQEDKLFHDDVGEDTVFGLDDYLEQQKQQQGKDDLAIGEHTGMELDYIDDEHLLYPQSPSPKPTTNSNKRITMHDDQDDDVEMELFQWMDSMDNDGMDPELASLLNNRNGSSRGNDNNNNNNNNNNNMPSSSKLLLTNIDTSIQQQQQQQPRRDFSKPPETGGFLTASCPRTGKPIYFPLQLKPSTTISSTSSGWLKQKNIQLLTTPIRLMFEQLDLEHKEKIQQAKLEEHQHYRRKMKKKKQIQAESQALWVEKYRPSIFMDLLGDQRVNRDALRWVKQWDYCVFGKKPQHESQRDKALRQYKATFGNTMGQQYEKKYDKQANDNNNNNAEKPKDTLLRPDRKILLLSGPPGFGKTTLAHVIGKQAGYNIVEVNASDDRTGEVVKTKIKSALEMQAILRNNDDKGGTTMYTKPNILIIDEIDGASAGGGADSFIKQLVDLASIEATAANDKSSSSSSSGGFHTKKPANNKKKKQPLLRPIICICNDVYAPVLRPLRMIAYHIPFRKVPNLNVARRLQEISQSEGLDTDLRALSLLAEMTDGDLRSCLNTLQFIRSKSTVFNKEMLMESDGLGKKDMGRTLFSTWDELFTAAHSKNRSLFTRGPQTDRYVQRLATSVSSTGDMEKLMQGCFEAYPLMKFHDQALSKVVQMGEWLDFYDHLSHRAHHLHDYSVYGYIPYTIINFHRFFAGSVAQEHRMEYPKVDYEMFAKKKSYDNLIKIFLTGIHPGHRRFLSRDELVLNVVPRLLRILSPDLRPVNKQLIKPKEKETLDRLVSVMLDYGLTFMQHKTEEGQFSFSLEPPMEELIWFESVTQKSVLTSRYAVRQMVMQEIETERLRRRELTMGELYDKSKKTKDPLPSTKKPGTEEIKKAATDFFGRPLEPKVSSSGQEDKCMEEVDVVSISYKYHEGFSNAVRKPMPVHLFF